MSHIRKDSSTVPDLVIPNSCDSHFHVMGPPEIYEYRENHVYAFEPAPLSEYLKAVKSTGIERYVLVQPSIYGLNNRCLLDTLDQLPAGSARGIVAINEDTSSAELKAMHERGVRGVRFNLVQGPNHDSDTILHTAKRISELGWHLEVYVQGNRLASLQAEVARMPVRLVIDHMGHIALGSPDEVEQVSALRRLLDTGKVWVKLIGYRLSSASFPFDDVHPLARHLVAQYSSRCLWGSDWPYANFKGRAPTPKDLLTALVRWTASDRERTAVLCGNPSDVYDFASRS